MHHNQEPDKPELHSTKEDERSREIQKLEHQIAEQLHLCELGLARVLEHHYGYSWYIAHHTWWQVYDGEKKLFDGSKSDAWRWLARPAGRGGPPRRWPAVAERENAIERWAAKIRKLKKHSST